MRPSNTLPSGISKTVKGYDFSNKPTDYNELLQSYARTGFQATAFGEAVDEVKRMMGWEASISQFQTPKEDQGETEIVEAVEEEPPSDNETSSELPKDEEKCKIYLGYTSNLVSSGLRESIRFLVQHKKVDVLVTTAGGIEEDIIKKLAPTYIGSFNRHNGQLLRKIACNRIGNLIVPNDNYCKFENWVTPRMDEMLRQQNEEVCQ